MWRVVAILTVAIVTVSCSSSSARSNTATTEPDQMAILACTRFDAMESTVEAGEPLEPGWVSAQVSEVARAGGQSSNAAISRASEVLLAAVQDGVPADAALEALSTSRVIMLSACKVVME